MDMKLTDEQAQLQDGARRFMDKECTIAFVRQMEASEAGFSRPLWKRMAELGWIGLALPAEWGGLALGNLELAILMRELGRHICPSATNGRIPALLRLTRWRRPKPLPGPTGPMPKSSSRSTNPDRSRHSVSGGRGLSWSCC